MTGSKHIFNIEVLSRLLDDCFLRIQNILHGYAEYWLKVFFTSLVSVI